MKGKLLCTSAIVAAAGGAFLLIAGRAFSSGFAQELPPEKNWRKAKIPSQTGKTLEVAAVSLPNGNQWLVVGGSSGKPSGEVVRYLDIKSITVLGFTETGGTSRKVNASVTTKDGKTRSDQGVQSDYDQIGVYFSQSKTEDVEQLMARFGPGGGKDWTLETTAGGRLHGNIRLKLIKEIEFIQ